MQCVIQQGAALANSKFASTHSRYTALSCYHRFLIFTWGLLQRSVTCYFSKVVKSCLVVTNHCSVFCFVIILQTHGSITQTGLLGRHGDTAKFCSQEQGIPLGAELEPSLSQRLLFMPSVSAGLYFLINVVLASSVHQTVGSVVVNHIVSQILSLFHGVDLIIGEWKHVCGLLRC